MFKIVSMAVVAACLCAGAGQAAAQAAGEAAYVKECAACHMAFPAQLLPARSWTAVMQGLASHFGENAALDAASTTAIAAYLAAHAADAPHMDRHALRGLAANATPLRITETPAWIREHKGEVSAADFASPKVKTKSNCAACHRDAARGIFGDD